MADTIRPVLTDARLAPPGWPARSRMRWGAAATTHVPREVAEVIDATLRELYRIRSRAVDESHRRMDAAMARSAALLRDRPRGR
jgi:hypothetical protein